MPAPARTPSALAVLAFALLGPAPPARAQALASPAAPSAARAGVRSLVVPGWGQRSLGQRRALVYAAAEAVLWGFWVERRADAAKLRADYRDLAWDAARLRTGEREDGSWSYYEAVSKWSRSGAFDRDPAASGLQPEEDPATFNGSVWVLAREIHFRGGTPAPGDPSWQAALAWYGQRAYADGFLWDWSGRAGELAQYRRLIHESDDRFHQATTAVGVVLANHLLAGTDAFVSARLSGRAEVRLGPPASGIRGPLWLTLTWAPSR